MTKSNVRTDPQGLVTQLQLARIQLTRVGSRLDSAKETARVAKRRRKEAKQAVRRARKKVRQAKAEVAEATQAVLNAEEQLARVRKMPTMRRKPVKPGRTKTASAPTFKKQKQAPPGDQPISARARAMTGDAEAAHAVPTPEAPLPSPQEVVEVPKSP
jgi:hypothetical protein